MEAVESRRSCSAAGASALVAVTNTSATCGILVGEPLALDCGLRLVSWMVDSSPRLECSLGLPFGDWGPPVLEAQDPRKDHVPKEGHLKILGPENEGCGTLTTALLRVHS